MNSSDASGPRSQSQVNDHDGQTRQTRAMAQRDTEDTASAPSTETAAYKKCSTNHPNGQQHVHWGAAPAQCEIETHNHLHKLKSPPPRQCDESTSEMTDQDRSLIAKVKKIHPIVDIGAKSRDLFHSKHPHAEKVGVSDEEGTGLT